MIQFSFDMPLILMGFYGGVMVLVVLLLRFLMGRWLPKRLTPVLWGLVLIRLLVPFSISSPLSLPVPGFLEDFAASRVENITYMTFEPKEAFSIEGSAFEPVTVIDSATVSSAPSVDFGLVDSIEEEKQQALEAHQAEVMDRILNDAVQVEVTQGLGGINWSYWLPSLWGVNVAMIWLVGMAVTALVFCWRYIHSRRGFQGVYELDENQTIRQTLINCRVEARAYSCDTAKSPMVVGLLQPMILLPASLDFTNEELLRHIVTHESMHIRRRDNLTKLILMAALCIHWYNPLVWVMAREFCRDMESACDEAALVKLGGEESASYAGSLLAMAVPGLSGGLFASAFSRTEVERRVKGVLGYKKPGFFTLTAAAMLLACSTVAFATCGQGFFDDTLSDWCYSGETYIARATLTRPIDLGSSWNRARSLANQEIYEVLRDAAADIRVEMLENTIQKRLAGVFGVEPGAFKVEVAPMVDREKLMEEYKGYGLEKDERGQWTMNGEKVHYLEDEVTGILYADSEGTVDVYVIRDEQYKLLRVESYAYYRF